MAPKQTVPKRDGKPIKLVTICEALAEHASNEARSKAASVERRARWFKEVPELFSKNEMGGLVYFIDCLDLTKIGFTSKPIHERIETWLNGNPFELLIFALVPGTLEKERELHLRFGKLRQRREWFRLSPEARVEIVELAESGGGVISNRARLWV